MAQSLRADTGKSDFQRLRPFLVMQYFLKNADERHPVSMQDILLFLNEDCEISAERRAIYKDIEDINKILYMLDRQGDETAKGFPDQYDKCGKPLG